MVSGKTGRGKRILVAGGGTGGHLFPGIAIARGLKARFDEVDILFVVGRKKMEKEIINKAGFEARSIDVEGMMGRNLVGGIKALGKMFISSLQSLALIREFKPHLVVGVGGYSSGPVCLIARFLGIPIGIHEQNSFPGLTNRILAPLATKVFISFGETRRYLKRGNVFLTGNPIREELLDYKSLPRETEGSFVILVVGGSQGAHAINAAVVSALEELKAKWLHPFVIHQTGEKDREKISDDYRVLGLEGDVSAFIDDMASAYGRADLVICRAGATTIAELAALGKPSILIPYPHAARGHQDMNARALVGIGGADMIPEGELTGHSLAETIRKYMEHRGALKKMSSLALGAGKPQARDVIVEQLTELMGVQ
jgi:UDP-N-acetylglucosamine--N-acetylmuramyl-(pentapeptide) pyrophosphoryl-undecaprenol N-acetylglucosamine transferase